MTPTKGRRCWLILIALAIVALIAPGVLQAGPIVGELDISGNMRFTSNSIDWQPPLGLPNGTFNVENTSTGYFAGLGNPVETTGAALDLSFIFQPVGIPFFFDDFITFTLAGFQGLSFDLQFIQPGATVSAFNMIETNPGPPGSTNLSFSMRGTVMDTSNPGELSYWLGTWSADINQTVDGIKSILVAGGSIDSLYSAEITVQSTQPVPEPATMLLLASGLVGLAGVRRFNKS